MIRNGFFALVFLVGFISNAICQDFGYLGKKNLFSLSSTGSRRTLMNLADVTYRSENIGINQIQYDDQNKLQQKKKHFRYDLRVSYARQLSRRFALGVEVSHEEINMAHNNESGLAKPNLTYSTPVVNKLGSYLTFTTNSIYKLSFVGYSSTFGVGPSFYTFDFEQNYRFNEKDEIKYAYPDYSKSIRGINVFWQPSIRLFITRFLLLDVGMRVQSGFVFIGDNQLKNGSSYNKDVPSIPDSPDPDYYSQFDDIAIWNKEELARYLRVDQLTHLIAFRLGLCFMF